MDWLIDSRSRSIYSFYENTIVYLSLLGLGSPNEILDMSITEITNLKQIMQNEDMLKLRYNLLGVPTKD